MKFKLAIIFFLTCNYIFPQTKYFIKYKDHVPIEECKQHLSQKIKNVKLSNRFNQTPKSIYSKNIFDRIFTINIPSDQESILLELKSNSEIEYIQKSVNYKIDLAPIDSLYDEQWGLQNINAEKSWDLIPQNSETIILALIDTGIDYLHPDLKNQIFRNQGELGIDKNGNNKSNNGIDDDENGFVDDFSGWDFVNKTEIYNSEINYDFTNWDNDPIDEHGHGTNIAGIIGAEHNEIGIAGINPKIKILNLRAFDKNGNGEEDDAASAIIYAVNMGAKIINMSWGDSEYSQVLKDVLDFAYSNGVILVGSSGNSGSNLPHYPSSFSNVISVGAIQKDKTIASFSNYGSTIDLVAPGSQVITTNLNNSYKSVSGTSISTPFVSAAISIILSFNNFNNEEIKQIIKTTCNDLGEAGWDDKFGAGNLDLEKALKFLLPSEIKINYPPNEFYTSEENIKINISCISPSFKSYNLQYGIGLNPTRWINIDLQNNQYQILNEDVYSFDLSKLVDTTYTIQLYLNTIDNKTIIERSYFTIDRTQPEILSFSFSTIILNDEETLQASIISDDKTSAQIFFRNKFSNDNFQSTYLDEFNSDIKNISQKHFSFIPTNLIKNNLDIEFYFVVTNQAGKQILIKDGDNFFTSENSFKKNLQSYEKKNYTIQSGRIFPNKIKFNGLENNFLLVNEILSATDLSIFEFQNSQFVKVNSLKNRIPISVGNFNDNENTEILSLFVKSGFIETQIENGSINFRNVFNDSSQTFWPALAENIDSDSNIEIIAFSDDRTISIWEVQNDFQMIKENDLQIYNSNNNQNSIFRNNEILVGDFDNDLSNEICASDNFGNLIFYEIKNHGNFTNDFLIKIFSGYESQTQMAKGDFNGDGILDIASLTKIDDKNYELPIFHVSVFSFIENKFERIFEKSILKTDENFTSSFDKSYSSIRFANIIDDEKEELIISQNPNLYIFEFDEEIDNLIFHLTNVNSQSIFWGDIDENGINEIGIPQNDLINFFELNNKSEIITPQIIDYYSIDSIKSYFEWKSENSQTIIYKGKNPQNLAKYDSTFNNYYIDSVSSNETYFYAIQIKNILNNSVSNKSKIISIFSHAPGNFISLKILNQNSIELLFSIHVDKSSIKLNNIFINDENPNSFVFSSEKSLIIFTNSKLESDDNNLIFKNFRDIYNTPFPDSSINFQTDFNNFTENELLIINFKIIDNYKINIIFNFNLDSLTALNINNYEFLPKNNIKQLNLDKFEGKSLNVIVENPIGSVGKDYILSIKNIFSSKESGYFPIKENAGSQIILTSNSENLNKIFVYPNPVNLNEVEEMTFANLTQFAEILIYSLDGIFVKKLVENDGNGGISWNLINENNIKISSGIYIFKVISKDFEGKNIQEKLGKFAVIR
ncbi:MAG: S8 family serine peptidase [Ignavibacteriae bacterium]|nr:S8 family serine peptidase [Ignavibacteriota bacterium]